MLVATVGTQVFLVPILLVLLALITVWALFLVGLILVLDQRRKGPPGSKGLIAVLLAVGLASMSVLLGTTVYGLYASRSPWTFSYRVSVTGNGSSPESVVVPIPQDESLLNRLQLTSGMANWSFVDTPKGRGLYIAFTGSASLGVDVSLSLAPSPPPDVNNTMQVPYIASVADYRWWVLYQGQAGGVLDLDFGCYNVHTYLVPGWIAASASCPNPDLPPLA